MVAFQARRAALERDSERAEWHTKERQLYEAKHAAEDRSRQRLAQSGPLPMFRSRPENPKFGTGTYVDCAWASGPLPKELVRQPPVK